jgi:hypothetical protein
MKTISQVKKQNPDYSALIHAVVSRIGKESIEDVINHGIDGGFRGFIYYTDTVKFGRPTGRSSPKWPKAWPKTWELMSLT